MAPVEKVLNFDFRAASLAISSALCFLFKCIDPGGEQRAHESCNLVVSHGEAVNKSAGQYKEDAASLRSSVPP